MEQEYSVGTTNRYALFLGEEDDPGDVVIPSSVKPEKDVSGKNSKEKGGSKQQGKGTKGKENKERIAKEQQSKKAAIENAAKGQCASMLHNFDITSELLPYMYSCMSMLVEF